MGLNFHGNGNLGVAECDSDFTIQEILLTPLHRIQYSLNTGCRKSALTLRAPFSSMTAVGFTVWKITEDIIGRVGKREERREENLCFGFLPLFPTMTRLKKDLT